MSDLQINLITTDLKNALFNSDIKDITLDYAELSIENILRNELVAQIPIVKTFYAVVKTAINIQERNLLKQTLIFINEFNNNKESKIVQKYKKQFDKDQKRLKKELERVLILLNRNIEDEKSKYLAKLYTSYISEEIDWNKFCELCDVVERLFISDIESLKNAYENNGINDFKTISYKHDRLLSIGLLRTKSIAGEMFWEEINITQKNNLMELTELGKKFCQIIFKK